MKPVHAFKANPFANGRDLKLVDVPPVGETHEVKKPVRSYLAAGRGGMDGLFDALGGGRKGPKATVYERTVLREPAAENDAQDEPAAASSPRKWGRA